MSFSGATEPGLSSSCRMRVTISPRRVSSSGSGNSGLHHDVGEERHDRLQNPRRDMCRRARSRDGSPRRSATRRGRRAPRQCRPPTACACHGRWCATRNVPDPRPFRDRKSSPRLTDACRVTAGVTLDSLASRVTPFASTSRTGARPFDVPGRTAAALVDGNGVPTFSELIATRVPPPPLHRKPSSRLAEEARTTRSSGSWNEGACARPRPRHRASPLR